MPRLPYSAETSIVEIQKGSSYAGNRAAESSRLRETRTVRSGSPRNRRDLRTSGWCPWCEGLAFSFARRRIPVLIAASVTFVRSDARKDRDERLGVVRRRRRTGLHRPADAGIGMGGD